jgi:hypothetical protein
MIPQEKKYFCAPLGLKLPLVHHNWPPTVIARGFAPASSYFRPLPWPIARGFRPGLCEDSTGTEFTRIYD